MTTTTTDLDALIETASEVRVLLNRRGDSLARYRRPERSSADGTTTSNEEQ